MSGEWELRASCRGEKRDLWFSGVATDQEEAKAICTGCPVLAECLAMALADDLIIGIWGATDREERRRIRRGKNIPTGNLAALLAASPHRHRDGRPMRLHVLDSEGNSICRPGTRIDADSTVLAKDVPRTVRCRLPLCKETWHRIDYLEDRCA